MEALKTRDYLNLQSEKKIQAAMIDGGMVSLCWRGDCVFQQNDQSKWLWQSLRMKFGFYKQKDFEPKWNK